MLWLRHFSQRSSWYQLAVRSLAGSQGCLRMLLRRKQSSQWCLSLRNTIYCIPLLTILYLRNLSSCSVNILTLFILTFSSLTVSEDDTQSPSIALATCYVSQDLTCSDQYNVKEGWMIWDFQAQASEFPSDFILWKKDAMYYMRLPRAFITWSPQSRCLVSCTTGLHKISGITEPFPTAA